MVKKNLLLIPIFLLFVLLVNSASGQQLHHQMLSAMGSNTTLNSGMIVLQTVGQQSVTGNKTINNVSLQQGFQQSPLSKFFPMLNVNTFTTTVYPNPFTSSVKVNFSQNIEGVMSIALYNMFGVLIFKEEKKNYQQPLSFNFEHLPTGSYILHLRANNYAYSKTLIKQ